MRTRRPPPPVVQERRERAAAARRKRGPSQTRLGPRGQCEVSLFEHRPGGERHMTERALNAPAFQGQKFANACQARNASLRSHSPKPGVRIRLIAVRGPCWNVIWPRSRQGSAFRAVTWRRKATGSHEPLKRQAQRCSPALGGGPATCSGGLGAAMFLSVNWRPRFADPSLLRY
jgi:hypothetical protein